MGSKRLGSPLTDFKGPRLMREVSIQFLQGSPGLGRVTREKDIEKGSGEQEIATTSEQHKLAC